MWVPQNGRFIIEHPINIVNMDDNWGYPRNLGNLHSSFINLEPVARRSSQSVVISTQSVCCSPLMATI